MLMKKTFSSMQVLYRGKKAPIRGWREVGEVCPWKKLAFPKNSIIFPRQNVTVQSRIQKPVKHQRCSVLRK